MTNCYQFCHIFNTLWLKMIPKVSEENKYSPRAGRRARNFFQVCVTVVTRISFHSSGNPWGGCVSWWTHFFPLFFVSQITSFSTLLSGLWPDQLVGNSELSIIGLDLIWLSQISCLSKENTWIPCSHDRAEYGLRLISSKATYSHFSDFRAGCIFIWFSILCVP